MAALAGAPIVQVYHEKSMILPDVSRVLACLYEKGIKFEPHTVSYKSLLRLQASSHAPVPFYDGPTFLEESREICRYIAEKYEHHGYPFLLGKDALERASVEQWLHNEEHSFNPPSRALFCHLAFPMDEDDGDDIEMHKRKLNEVLEVYEQRLSDSEFLVGNKFTLADLVHLPNSHYIKASNEFLYLYDSRKNVRRWWDAISKRDSWKKVLEYMHRVENKEEELKKQQQQRDDPRASSHSIQIFSTKQTSTEPRTIFVSSADAVSSSSIVQKPLPSDVFRNETLVSSSQINRADNKTSEVQSKETTTFVTPQETPPTPVQSIPITSKKYSIPVQSTKDAASLTPAKKPPIADAAQSSTKDASTLEPSSSKDVSTNLDVFDYHPSHTDEETTYIKPTPPKPSETLDAFSGSNIDTSHTKTSSISAKVPDQPSASDSYKSDSRATGVESQFKESVTYSGRTPSELEPTSASKLHTTDVHRKLQAEQWHAATTGLNDIKEDADHLMSTGQGKLRYDVQQYQSQDSEQATSHPVPQGPMNMELVQGREKITQRPYTDQSRDVVSPLPQQTADALEIVEDNASSDKKGALWSPSKQEHDVPPPRQAANKYAQSMIPSQAGYSVGQDTSKQHRDPGFVSTQRPVQDARVTFDESKASDSTISNERFSYASRSSPRKDLDGIHHATAPFEKKYPGNEDTSNQAKDKISTPWQMTDQDAEDTTEEKKISESSSSQVQHSYVQRADAPSQRQETIEDPHSATPLIQKKYANVKDTPGLSRDTAFKPMQTIGQDDQETFRERKDSQERPQTIPAGVKADSSTPKRQQAFDAPNTSDEKLNASELSRAKSKGDFSVEEQYREDTTDGQKVAPPLLSREVASQVQPPSEPSHDAVFHGDLSGQPSTIDQWRRASVPLHDVTPSFVDDEMTISTVDQNPTPTSQQESGEQIVEPPVPLGAETSGGQLASPSFPGASVDDHSTISKKFVKQPIIDERVGEPIQMRISNPDAHPSSELTKGATLKSHQISDLGHVGTPDSDRQISEAKKTRDDPAIVHEDVYDANLSTHDMSKDTLKETKVAEYKPSSAKPMSIERPALTPSRQTQLEEIRDKTMQSRETIPEQQKMVERKTGMSGEQSPDLQKAIRPSRQLAAEDAPTGDIIRPRDILDTSKESRGTFEEATGHGSTLPKAQVLDAQDSELAKGEPTIPTSDQRKDWKDAKDDETIMTEEKSFSTERLKDMLQESESTTPKTQPTDSQSSSMEKTSSIYKTGPLPVQDSQDETQTIPAGDKVNSSTPSDKGAARGAQSISVEPIEADINVSAANYTNVPQMISRQQARPSAPSTRGIPASDTQGVIGKIQESTPDNRHTDDSGKPFVPSQEQVSHASQGIPGQEEMMYPPSTRVPTSDTKLASAEVHEVTPNDQHALESITPLVPSAKQGSQVGSAFESGEVGPTEKKLAPSDQEKKTVVPTAEQIKAQPTIIGRQETPDDRKEVLTSEDVLGTTPTRGDVQPTGSIEPTRRPLSARGEEPTSATQAPSPRVVRDSSHTDDIFAELENVQSMKSSTTPDARDITCSSKPGEVAFTEQESAPSGQGSADPAQPAFSLRLRNADIRDMASSALLVSSTDPSQGDADQAKDSQTTPRQQDILLTQHPSRKVQENIPGDDLGEAKPSRPSSGKHSVQPSFSTEPTKEDTVAATDQTTTQEKIIDQNYMTPALDKVKNPLSDTLYASRETQKGTDYEKLPSQWQVSPDRHVSEAPDGLIPEAHSDVVDKETTPVSSQAETSNNVPYSTPIYGDAHLSSGDMPAVSSLSETQDLQGSASAQNVPTDSLGKIESPRNLSTDQVTAPVMSPTVPSLAPLGTVPGTNSVQEPQQASTVELESVPDTQHDQELAHIPEPPSSSEPRKEEANAAAGDQPNVPQGPETTVQHQVKAPSPDAREALQKDQQPSHVVLPSDLHDGSTSEVHSAVVDKETPRLLSQEQTSASERNSTLATGDVPPTSSLKKRETEHPPATQVPTSQVLQSSVFTQDDSLGNIESPRQASTDQVMAPVINPAEPSDAPQGADKDISPAPGTAKTPAPSTPDASRKVQESTPDDGHIDEPLPSQEQVSLRGSYYEPREANDPYGTNVDEKIATSPSNQANTSDSGSGLALTLGVSLPSTGERPAKISFPEPGAQTRLPAETQDISLDALSKAKSTGQVAKALTGDPASPLETQPGSSQRQGEAVPAEQKFGVSDKESADASKSLSSAEPRKKETNASTADQTSVPQESPRDDDQVRNLVDPLIASQEEALHAERASEGSTLEVHSSVADKKTTLPSNQAQTSSTGPDLTQIGGDAHLSGADELATSSLKKQEAEPAAATQAPTSQVIQDSAFSHNGSFGNTDSPKEVSTEQVMAPVINSSAPSDAPQGTEPGRNSSQSLQPPFSNEPTKEDTVVTAADQARDIQTITHEQATTLAPSIPKTQFSGTVDASRKIQKSTPDDGHIDEPLPSQEQVSLLGSSSEPREGQLADPHGTNIDEKAATSPSIQANVSDSMSGLAPILGDVLPSTGKVPAIIYFPEPGAQTQVPAVTQDGSLDALSKAKPTGQGAKAPIGDPASSLDTQPGSSQTQGKAALVQQKLAVSDTKIASASKSSFSDVPREEETNVATADQTSLPETTVTNQVASATPDASDTLGEDQESSRDDRVSISANVPVNEKAASYVGHASEESSDTVDKKMTRPPSGTQTSNTVSDSTPYNSDAYLSNAGVPTTNFAQNQDVQPPATQALTTQAPQGSPSFPIVPASQEKLDTPRLPSTMAPVTSPAAPSGAPQGTESGTHSVQPSQASFDFSSDEKTRATQGDQVSTLPNGNLSTNQVGGQSERNSQWNLKGASTDEKSRTQKIDQFGTQLFKDESKEGDGTLRSTISTAFDEFQKQPSWPKGRMGSSEKTENQQQADQAIVESQERNENQSEQTKQHETETIAPENMEASENTNQKNNRRSQVETLDLSGKQGSRVQQLGENTKDAPNITEDAPGDIQALGKSEGGSRSSEESRLLLQSEHKNQGGETEVPSSEIGHPSRRGLPGNSYQNNSSQSQAEAPDKSVEQTSPGIQNKDNSSSRLDGSTDPTKPGYTKE